ncbi:MAG: hypothetical protein JXA30_02960 [Deltaproteobacteria bacterium]|nr:hypothetical protein [Deltaproteobacteria bacterium]
MKVTPAYRRTRRDFVSFGFVLMVAFSAGCSDAGSGVSGSACTTDDDCPSGYACVPSGGSAVCRRNGGGEDSSGGGSPGAGGSSAAGGSGGHSGESGKGGSAESGGSGGIDIGSGGTTDGGSGGIDIGSGGTNGGSSGGDVSCAGYPVWNSKVIYNTAGELVEYNCKLYKNQGFAYEVNPETNNGQYYQWLLIGSCSESDCAMGEGPWIACGNYDHWTSGDYEIYNNVWGGGAGTQCITAWDEGHWTVQSTQPATSGVKSYPNSGFVNVGKSISSLVTFTSSFDITVPSTGDWEASYDIWVPSEIMIWMYTVGNVGPIATSWDSEGKPVPSATDLTLGGHTWNVYHQSGGTNVISFVRTANTTSATVDILALLNWARDQGWIQDGTIGAAQFGFEISGTDNVPIDFACKSFSMTIN